MTPTGTAPPRFHAAVVEDNEAYNAKDAARYEATLNPRMIFWQDGDATYGRDAIMATARAAFATPDWTWSSTIESETSRVPHRRRGRSSPGRPGGGSNLTASATMYMVREHGKWTVAMDTVHVLTRTPPTQG